MIVAFILGAFCADRQSHVASHKGPDPLKAVARLFNGDKTDDGFLQRMSKSEAEKTFGAALKATKADTSGFLVASFALAMRGVDMDANVSRICAPLKDAAGQIESIAPSGGLEKDQILPEDIPTALYEIYKVRHFQPALKALFTTPIDGAVAESRDDDVMDAVSRTPADVLRLAAQDAAIYSKLWDIIDWNIGPASDRQALIKRLKAGHWPSPEIRHTATHLANDLRQPKHRTDR